MKAAGCGLVEELIRGCMTLWCLIVRNVWFDQTILSELYCRVKECIGIKAQQAERKYSMKYRYLTVTHSRSNRIMSIVLQQILKYKLAILSIVIISKGSCIQSRGNKFHKDQE